MKEITIICPIFNEEENINRFIYKFKEIFKHNDKYKFFILFADNASTDNSKKFCKIFVKMTIILSISDTLKIMV